MSDRQEQDAALLYQQARTDLESQRQSLDRMRVYREEYLQRFQAAGSSGMTGDQIKDYRRFIAKLDQAIGQLEVQIGACERTCEQRRRDWLSRRTRTKVLDQVITRYQAEEAWDELRREEREADEHTTQGHGKRGRGE